MSISSLDTLRLIASQINDPLTWRAFALVNKKTAQIARELMLTKQDQFTIQQYITHSKLEKTKLYRQTLPNGNKHGLQRVFRDDVEIETTMYRNGVKHGKYTKYNQFGKLNTIILYNNGTQVSIEYLRTHSIFSGLRLRGNVYVPCDNPDCGFQPSCRIRYGIITGIAEYAKHKIE